MLFRVIQRLTLISVGFLLISGVTAKAAIPSVGKLLIPTPLLLPFPSGEIWYICQGYNGQISHNGSYSLDLSIAPTSPGPTGCTSNTAGASSGKSVTAPGAGNVFQGSGADAIYIKFDSGGAMILGHLTHKWAVASSNTLLGHVVAGEQIGSINAPGVGNNGGYAHLHIQMFPTYNVNSGNVPFDDANQTRFQCAPNMPDLGSTTTNQYSGTALGRCNQPPNIPNPLAPANNSMIYNPSVTLNWQDTGDPDNYPQDYRNYRVEIWKSDNSWSQSWGWNAATSWIITVPSGGTYCWKVQSGDGAAGSGFSPTWCFTVNQAPNIPLQLGPTQGSIVNAGSTTLSWQDTGDPDNVPQNYRTFSAWLWKSDNSWSTFHDWDTATTWSLTLDPGQYCWKVQSGDGAVGSGFSPTWCFTIKNLKVYLPLLTKR